MAYCNKCGKPLDPGSKYCWNCGAEVSVHVRENDQQKAANGGNAGNKGFRNVIQGMEKWNMPDVAVDALASAGIAFGANNQKIELVRNHPVPDTMEELYALAEMAYHNIIEYEYAVQPNGIKARLMDAWFFKLEEACKKAKEAFGDDPKTKKMESMYAEKAEAIANNKKLHQQGLDQNMNTILKLAISFGICMAVFMALIIMLPILIALF